MYKNRRLCKRLVYHFVDGGQSGFLFTSGSEIPECVPVFPFVAHLLCFPALKEGGICGKCGNLIEGQGFFLEVGWLFFISVFVSSWGGGWSPEESQHGPFTFHSQEIFDTNTSLLRLHCFQLKSPVTED